jgi:hypothetical protein
VRRYERRLFSRSVVPLADPAVDGDLSQSNSLGHRTVEAPQIKFMFKMDKKMQRRIAIEGPPHRVERHSYRERCRRTARAATKALILEGFIPSTRYRRAAHPPTPAPWPVPLLSHISCLPSAGKVGCHHPHLLAQHARRHRARARLTEAHFGVGSARYWPFAHSRSHPSGALARCGFGLAIIHSKFFQEDCGSLYRP